MPRKRRKRRNVYPKLDTAALHRLMQRYQLTAKDLSRLTGCPLAYVNAWINGTQTPPISLQAVIENQEKYKAILPREFRAIIDARDTKQATFQKPLPRIE